MTAVNRTLARLRLCRMKMRREGKLWVDGYKPPIGEGVQRIWHRAGWRRPQWKWDYDQRGWRPVRGSIHVVTDATVGHRESA